MSDEITLTKQELEDLKDEIKFRAKVCLELKLMRGLPKKVAQLEVLTGVMLTIIICVLRYILK